MRTLNKSITLCGITLIFCNMLLGCSSSGKNPAAPAEPLAASTSEKPNPYNHTLWGIWEIHFAASDLTITPVLIRDLQAHFNITSYLLPPACNNCLKINANSYDPATHIIDADVTLHNPFKISGYDVRGIIFTNDYGLGLINADDWTGLWDFPGGQTINPFKAFAKDQPNRIFAGEAEHTEKFQVYIPVLPPVEAVNFAVDVSYPGNCDEPSEITNFWQEPLSSFKGSSTNIYVDVRDWQGDVNKVTLVAPQVTGEQFTQFSHWDGDTWGLNITNNTGAGPGDYVCRVIAVSKGSGALALYDYIILTIPSSVFKPVDITSPGVNVSYGPVCIDGNYAYIRGGSGINVFDIADPLNPVWLNWFDAYLYITKMVASDGYLYIMGSSSGVQVADIHSPENSYLAYILPTPGCTYDIAIQQGYGYVADGDGGLQVIKIDLPDSLSIVGSLTIPSHSFWNISVSGSYAYVFDNYAGNGKLQIIDISDPESPALEKTCFLQNWWKDMEVSDGYVYGVGEADGLTIFDVDPPDQAHVEKEVAGTNDARSIELSGGYAYLIGPTLGMRIVDIDPIENASVAYVVNNSKGLYYLTVNDGYAYSGMGDALRIFDIDPVDSSHLVKYLISLTYISSLAVSGDYLYAIGAVNGLRLVDISNLYFPKALKAICMGACSPGAVALSDGYAYAVTSFTTDESLYSAFYIFDVDPPGVLPVIKQINTLAISRDLAVNGGYAYVTDYSYGLRIIDIDPPESAYIVNTLDTPDHSNGVDISGGYAYVAAEADGLQIIDIDPPESAHISNTLHFPGTSNDVFISGDYAYLTNTSAGLYILDITTVDDPQIVNIVSVPGVPNRITLSDGYAYVTAGQAGLQIIDIDPPESACIVSAIDTPVYAQDVAVSGEYAFVADNKGGLRIIKLW